jgi:hypothetical protein
VGIAAPQPESLVTDGVRSLEVRWIFPGQLDAAVAGWFGRFPAGVESREDTYLLDPRLRRLSVKIRGGEALEVKVYGGSPGILEVPGRARGRMDAGHLHKTVRCAAAAGGHDAAHAWRRTLRRGSPVTAPNMIVAARPASTLPDGKART